MKYLLLLIFIVIAKSADRKYTYFSQCDGRWKNNQLGTCSQTICSAGCAITSVAMMMNTKGKISDPAALNTWLKTHGGYVSGCSLLWGSIQGCKFIGKVGRDSVKSSFDQGRHVILNVRNGGHWYLMNI